MDNHGLIQNFLSQSSITLNSSRNHQMMMQSAALLVNEEESRKRKRGGSKPGRQPNLPPNFEEGHQLLYKHYFAPDPLYPPHIF
jgi:hypothetical protein